MSPPELASDIGRNLRLARAARGLRQEDLAQASGASLQAIKNLEGGGKVELITFLKVAQALNLARGVWESCQPQPQTLDEIERIEAARADTSRVRPRL
jgi:transcriptional regulator with XRE-family HTH domain